MILIDLQKALDTIDHNILLLKMSLLGFSREVTEIGIIHTYPVGNSMLMFMTDSLSLPIYDAEYHKD